LNSDCALTTSATGELATSATGVKSFTGSCGRLL
jgi:hypothetical protein